MDTNPTADSTLAPSMPSAPSVPPVPAQPTPPPPAPSALVPNIPPPPAPAPGTLAAAPPPAPGTRMKLPQPTRADLFFAVFLTALGFCFWEWDVLSERMGVGVTLFFLLAIGGTFLYLRSKGVRQNAKSLLLLLAALVGSAPFVLYGYREEVNFMFLLHESALCLLWVAYSCRTTISDKLSGLIVGDVLNQALIVPFANLTSFFTRPLGSVNSRRSLWLPPLLALVGVIVCIPVFALVTWLLASSDDGFRAFMETLSEYLILDDIVRYIFEFVLALPIAIYIFGAVIGNVFRHRTASFSAEGLRGSFSAAHILPKAVLYTPLVLFVALYVIYFLVMGNYLFSALQSELPAAYTYAQYARRGFFELCGVASVNLIILAGIWLFAKRGDREYPWPLRILAGLLSLLTCLLIVTAASKMLLYIQTYGLTPLRVYTLWAMALMMLAFFLFIAWHVRPFNAARPVVVLVVVAILALGLTDTSGLIAEYNVDRYLAGEADRANKPDKPETINLLDPSEAVPIPQAPELRPEGPALADSIDIDFLAELGDPAVPALYRLKESASDPEVVQAAAEAIEGSYAWWHTAWIDDGIKPKPWTHWPEWNLSHQRAEQLHKLAGLPTE